MNSQRLAPGPDDDPDDDEATPRAKGNGVDSRKRNHDQFEDEEEAEDRTPQPQRHKQSRVLSPYGYVILLPHFLHGNGKNVLMNSADADGSAAADDGSGGGGIFPPWSASRYGYVGIHIRFGGILNDYLLWDAFVYL